MAICTGHETGQILMQALADEEEDLLPDDSAIEIDSEECQCLTSLFIDTT
jgi:hypothetical protein